MGRTTTPLKQLVYRYSERLERVSEILGDNYREYLRYFIEDFDETVSAFSHIGLVDPLEVFLAHIVKKLGELSREIQEERDSGRCSRVCGS